MSLLRYLRPLGHRIEIKTIDLSGEVLGGREALSLSHCGMYSPSRASSNLLKVVISQLFTHRFLLQLRHDIYRKRYNAVCTTFDILIFCQKN